MKVAKLVTVSLMTRVVVDENASDEQIMDKAFKGLLNALESSALENIEEIKPDSDCPFGTFAGDFEIGQRVLVPDPNETDMHNHSFEGTVFSFRGSNIIVEDGENNGFEIEPKRLKLIEE